MGNLAHTISPGFISPPAMRERVSVVAIVVALHLAVVTAWQSQPPSAPVPEHEMEVMLAMPAATKVQTETLPVQSSLKIIPARQPRVEKPAPAPLQVEPVEPVKPVEPVEPVGSVVPSVPVELSSDVPATLPGKPWPVAAVTPVVVSSTQATPDVEPDYKASYLNNHLTYPLAARSMGLQGRVVLDVEVLAEGLCGQVNVRQSSGHEVLDNAAMQSVKTWKFIPARHAGDAVTKWFMLPIQFSLKDSEA